MPRPKAETWIALVFALLVIATTAAFAWSQRLKRDPLVIDRVTFVAVPRGGSAREGHAARRGVFTPNSDCRFDRVRVRFRTTQSDRGTVQVVKPGGKLVLTLARGVYLKRYTFHTYWWGGRERNDGLAPPGRYKLRVKLPGLDRVLVPPGAMRLHHGSSGPGQARDFCPTLYSKGSGS